MKNKYLILAALLISVSCSVKRNISVQEKEKNELEYFYTFTEATNRALLKDYSSALELFKYCIKKFPEKAAPYYQASQIYLMGNYIDIAKQYALKAVQIDDKNKWYLLNLGSIYNYQNNSDSLIYIYEKLIKISDDIEYEYQLANLYSIKGEYSKALNLTNKLDEEIKGTKEIMMMKHRIYDALNMKDSAVYVLENIIELFPDENENYGMLAEYLSVINQFGKAEEIYYELLRRSPENGMANISYADFFMKQNNIDSAYKYYVKGFKDTEISFEDKANIIYSFIYNPENLVKDSILIKKLIENLKTDYKDSRAYVLSAEYNLKMQKFESCLSELESAIKHGDKTYVVWEKYILMCNVLGKHEKIKEIYKDAIVKFPNAIKIYIYSGYSLLYLKNFDDVLNLCDSALNIKEKPLEDLVQVYNLMADSYRGKELYEESDSIYELILIKDPENLLIRNNYSYYLSLRMKNLQRAEELSRFTVKSDPKNSTYLDTYGWILYKMGNTKEAIKYIESAIKNGAYNNSEVLDHYGDIMLELNRCGEAIEAWQEAIKYDVNFSEKLNSKIDSAKSDCKNE